MEPLYCWNNTVDGVPVKIVGSSSNVAEGVNYINGPKPGYTPYVYPHPLLTGEPMPTQPGSRPPATGTPVAQIPPRKQWGGKRKKTKEVKRKTRKNANQ